MGQCYETTLVRGLTLVESVEAELELGISIELMQRCVANVGRW